MGPCSLFPPPVRDPPRRPSARPDMSAIPTDEIDASLDIQQQQNIQQVQPQQPTGTPSDTPRKRALSISHSAQSDYLP